MLVDPLGPDPLIVSGSANFNIYLGEFMRLYRHFAFRDFLASRPASASLEAEVSHLDEADTWWMGYLGTRHHFTD